MDRMKFLLRTYSLMRRSGALEQSVINRIFVSSYDLYKRLYEDPFYYLGRSRPELFRGGHVLDVGANIGYNACLFRKFVDPDCKVFAFEPELSNYRLLVQRVARARVGGQIVPIRAAVGADVGEAVLWFNEKHHGDHRIVTQSPRRAELDPTGLQTVPQWSIDAFLKAGSIDGGVRFVKIDVQGFELYVLEGMRKTIRANPNLLIALEYSPTQWVEFGFDRESLTDFMDRYRFWAYHLRRRKPMVQVAPSDLDRLCGTRGYLDVLLSREKLGGVSG